MGRKKKLPHIEVRTLANGYSLAIEGHKHEYMYFSPEKLMEGIVGHIGMHITEQLTPGQVMDMVDTASRWKDLGKTVREIKSLQTRLEGSIRQRNRIAVKLVSERNRYLGIRSEILTIQEMFKGLPNVVGFCEKVLRIYHSKRTITLASLDVKSDDILIGDESQADDEDEDADDTTTAGR